MSAPTESKAKTANSQNDDATTTTTTAAAPTSGNGLLGGGSVLATLKTGRIVPGCTNSEALLAKHKEFTGGKLYFRFPPEPNGYLHIGHAKSMRLNFGEAKANNGKCYLRYDDTNPETEEDEYIRAIEEMVRWMGWAPDMITFSSDYFDQLHTFAIQLIKAGKAYVCHSTSEMIKKQREDRTESPWRNRPVAESLKEFDWMRQGRYAESEATLRLKMDMTNDNPNMRDIIAYRIKFCEHPRSKDKWCIYPSYDYTHCIIDAIEHCDFSLCTLEFETRRESYFWLIEQLELFRPYVWEFSRLNVTGTLLSKRKINKLVEKKIVRGFDDPRLMTLAGLRRRGYTPAAINRFCELVGITRALNVIDVKMLENCQREDLDARCQRRFGLISPVPLVITNWQGADIDLTVSNHPTRTEMGTRPMTVTSELLVDLSDFRKTAEDKNFFGLAPGKVVGLRYAGNVTCEKFDEDKDGKVTKIYCTYDHDRAVKPKTNISWLSAKNSVPCEIRLYTYLLTDDKAAVEPDFMKYIDANSESVSHGAVEANVLGGFARHESVQFERFGYFCIDTDTDVENKKLVMNRVITLKEDKEKVAATGAAPAAAASNKKVAAEAKKEEKK